MILVIADLAFDISEMIGVIYGPLVPLVIAVIAGSIGIVAFFSLVGSIFNSDE